jgi:hypothetical protein
MRRATIILSGVILYSLAAYSHADTWSDAKGVVTDPIGAVTGRNKKIRDANADKRNAIAALQSQWQTEYQIAEKGRVAQNMLRVESAKVETLSAKLKSVGTESRRQCQLRSADQIFACRRSIGNMQLISEQLLGSLERLSRGLDDPSLSGGARSKELVEQARTAMQNGAAIFELVASANARIRANDVASLKALLEGPGDGARKRSCDSLTTTVAQHLNLSKADWTSAITRKAPDAMFAARSATRVYAELGKLVLDICATQDATFKTLVQKSLDFVKDPKTETLLEANFTIACANPRVTDVPELVEACSSGYRSEALYVSVGRTASGK